MTITECGNCGSRRFLRLRDGYEIGGTPGKTFACCKNCGWCKLVAVANIVAINPRPKSRRNKQNQ